MLVGAVFISDNYTINESLKNEESFDADQVALPGACGWCISQELLAE
ncbi:hypothetical Protein YC6258_03212 [Gynuella sunshinyii YC6258]|uniref:Uncharacterized protein n=1 Tax=Gynuella sunshinyii YC6258 TaxID=1445510 RepID=A0A0C5VPG8_9GAMM|nr:hypothetical Protein YC6258_03212 [Gynuella sunshinyii YC6258]